MFIESTNITAIPDLKKGTATVSLNTSIFNGNNAKENVALVYELSFSGKVIKTGNTTFSLSGVATQKANMEFALAKKEVKLWHFDFPNLYSIKIKIK